MRANSNGHSLNKLAERMVWEGSKAGRDRGRGRGTQGAKQLVTPRNPHSWGSLAML